MQKLEVPSAQLCQGVICLHVLPVTSGRTTKPSPVGPLVWGEPSPSLWEHILTRLDGTTMVPWKDGRLPLYDAVCPRTPFFTFYLALVTMESYYAEEKNTDHSLLPTLASCMLSVQQHNRRCSFSPKGARSHHLCAWSAARGASYCCTALEACTHGLWCLFCFKCQCIASCLIIMLVINQLVHLYSSPISHDGNELRITNQISI